MDLDITYKWLVYAMKVTMNKRDKVLDLRLKF